MAEFIVDITHIVISIFVPEAVFIANFKYEADRLKHRLGGLIGETPLNPFLPTWLVMLAGILLTIASSYIAGKLLAEKILSWLSTFDLIGLLLLNTFMISGGLFQAVYFKEGLNIDKRLFGMLIASLLTLIALLYKRGIIQ